MSKMAKPVRSFLQRGVARVPFSPSVQKHACQAILLFQTLLIELPHLPEEEQGKWKNIDRDGFGEPEHGWIPKSGEKHELSRYDRHDHKDVFHYHTDLGEILKRRGVVLAYYQRRLLELCHEVQQRCLETVLYPFARELDQQLPGYGFLELMRESSHPKRVEAWHNHALRLLEYRTSSDELVGKLHTDRCFLSVPIVSSEAGLIDKNGREFRTRAGQALIFAGDKMEHITKGEIEALVHGVRNREKNRRAAVCFGHTPTELPLHRELKYRARRRAEIPRP